MSRAYWSGPCPTCGGNTSISGFARWAHNHSLIHIEAMRTKYAHSARALREADQLLREREAQLQRQRERKQRLAGGSTS